MVQALDLRKACAVFLHQKANAGLVGHTPGNMLRIGPGYRAGRQPLCFLLQASGISFQVFS